MPPVLILLVCPGRQLRASCAGPSTPPAGSFLHKNTLKTIFCDCVGINMNVLSTRKVHFLPPHFRRKESTSVTLGQGSGWHRCLREPGPRCRLRERGRAVRPATDPSRRLKRLRLQGRSSSANMVGAGFWTPVLPRARRSDRGLGEQATRVTHGHDGRDQTRASHARVLPLTTVNTAHPCHLSVPVTATGHKPPA